MAEELISSSIDDTGMSMTYDLALTRVMAGAPEDIRPRLADALERLGFHVVDEQPLLAKRRVSKWSAWGCSSFVLDSPSTLLVSLKASGANATRLTFNYTIRTAWLRRGDRRTIAREVDAAVALAALRAQVGACGLCGTDAVEDSRFCRRCGAPLAAYEPAELEAMRLTAGSEAAYTNLAGGATFVVVAALIILGLTLIGPLVSADQTTAAKLVKVLWVIAWAFGNIGIVALLGGLWRLHHTLNARANEKELGAAAARRSVAAASGTAQLAPAPEAVSVTENTTELLNEGAEGRAIKLAARSRNTG